MKALVVMPVRRCSHCDEDRPMNTVNEYVLTCAACGTRRNR